MVHVGRRRGKSRSRILYWFRTPPGVRVGRAALDEEAIRFIEQHHPDIEFDWTRILKGEGAETRPSGRERIEKSRRRPDTRTASAPAGPGASAMSHAAEADYGGRSDVESDDAADVAGESGPDEDPYDERMEAGRLSAGPAALPGVNEPAEIEAGPSPAPATAAHARLGSEGVSRLRARYAELLARISERIQEPERREQLRTQAERLNPDTWVTDAEVSAGLEEYESVAEAVRTATGGQGRRRRRGGQRRSGGRDGSTPDEPGSGAAADDGEAQQTDTEGFDVPESRGLRSEGE